MLSISYVSGPVPRASEAVLSFTFSRVATTINSHFKEGEIEAERLNDLPKVTQTRGQQWILTQKHSYFKKKSKQCESCPKATEQGLAARLQKQHLGTRSFWELTELLCNRCQKPP